MNQFPQGENSAGAARKSNLRDFLIVVFRRRWIFLGIAVPIIGFGIYGLLTTTDSYTASAQILIEAAYLENPSFKPVIIEYDVLMSTASQVAQSIPVAERAATMLEDSIPKLQAKDPLLSEIRTPRDLRDVILRSISCGQVGESNILAINFSHRNPEFALLVVDAVTIAYIEYSIESRQNLKALDYYTEQINTLQDEINLLMEEKVAIFDRNGLSAFPVNNSAGIQQMRQIEYSYYEARSLRLGLENMNRTLVQAIAADPEYAPTPGSQEKASILRAKAELDQAVMDLAKLRMTYNDSSEIVLRQVEYVRRSREIFENERNGMVTDVSIQIDIARAKEAALFEALQNYRRELLAVPDIERQVYAVDLQVETQKDLLKALQIKRGEVKLKAEGDQRISNLVPLNQPTVDFSVGGGKKFIYLIFTAIIGVVLGFVVALLADSQDHRIYDRRQAESSLEIPVLGALSPPELPSERN